MKKSNKNHIFDNQDLGIAFSHEFNELKKFYLNIWTYWIDDYLRILPTIFFEKNEDNEFYFNEYVSFRAYYLLYLFFCFEENKYSINNSYIENNDSELKIEKLKNYMEVNFFNTTSTFTFFNIEIDKTAINEILKMVMNPLDYELSNKKLTEEEIKLLHVLNEDFRNILKNAITDFSNSLWDDKIKSYLIEKINSSSKNILKFLKKSRLNEIKWVTKEKTNENIK